MGKYEPGKLYELTKPSFNKPQKCIVVTIKVELHEGDKPDRKAIELSVNHGHYEIVKIDNG
jgi:hypothetical protein